MIGVDGEGGAGQTLALAAVLLACLAPILIVGLLALR